jgi:hypothetical protein
MEAAQRLMEVSQVPMESAFSAYTRSDADMDKKKKKRKGKKEGKCDKSRESEGA